ncbi:META domain-containing protein [Gordonia neofelifaecis]|uniref:Heat shock protein HslJ n=1 Tax=Gordonia neofelifaecis NRRL B-59395 TaxID=644548 RepID=F1YP54_9ACTN|nr:META domain-containing protein [Gordonia neofelifaecis]EGD53559.1 heat shock protein HslJ [Gordonia neofelifaecis NRRL B-59395]
MSIGRRMRARVAGSAAVVIAVVGAVTGCTDDDSTVPSDPAALVGNTYLSSQVNGPQIPGGGPLVLAFTKGQLSANAGCNGHGGSVAFDGDTMTTGNLVGTMMACPPPRDGADRWVSNLLGSPLTWHLDDQTLTLSRGDQQVTLVERQNRPVVGTRWQVTALVADDAVSTSAALRKSEPYFEIADDGRLSGSTGCNRMTGTAQVDGDRITFSPIATTRIACDPETTEVERTVLAALDGAATVEVDGDDMSLTNVAHGDVGLRLKAADGS